MLKERLVNEKIGIMTLTESHLNDEYLENEPEIEGYSSYRTDRTRGTSKGGVITYLENQLAEGATKLAEKSVGNIEFTILRIPKLNLLYIALYRPPTSEPQHFESVIRVIKDTIDSTREGMPKIVFTGDVNFPNIQWEGSIVHGGTTSLQNQAKMLLNLFDEYYIEQHVHQPTRGDNILDIFATNDHNFVGQLTVEDTQLSDHRILKIHTTAESEMSREQITPSENGLDQLNFQAGQIDWSKLQDEFSKESWAELRDCDCPDYAYKLILKKITDVAFQYVPVKKKRVISSIPRDRKVLMRNRIKNRKKLDNHNITQSERTQIENALDQIEVKLINSHNKEATSKEQQAIERIDTNPDFFFRYAKNKTCPKSSVGPIKSGEAFCSNPKEMGDLLQRHFESVYSTSTEAANIDKVIEDPGPRCLEDIDFTAEDIRKAILHISPKASAGLDGIPAILLRKCVEELLLPLTLLFRLSLNKGRLPSEFKLSKVIPIFKGGERCLAENYRPISLTSHICKVYERIVVKYLVDYLNDMNLFNPNQHGFRSGRSCLSQLLEHHQKILEILEGEGCVDSVYLDFSKAFDKVDYSILINKLRALGIAGQLLKWVHSFLTGRKQVVSIDGHTSSEGKVTSGVPQGSSLGPILFLIHIADIDDSLDHVFVSSFADDTRLMIGINKVEDTVKMQSDLNKTYMWAKENNMQFNTKKFEHLRYNHRSSLLTNLPSYSSPDGKVIQQVEAVKDLGVTMENSGLFDKQIEKVCCKSKRLAGWVLRTFRSREAKVMLILFKALVLPHLEYSCQLWSPVTAGNIGKLEAVQRNFTSKIWGMENFNYWERLEKLNLYSLERRRERYIILYTFKIIQNLVPNFAANRFQISTSFSERRGRSCKIPSLNTSARGGIKTMVDASFAVRGPRLFNKLPKMLRNFEGSLETFKVKLDKFLKTVPDRPFLPNYPGQSSVSNSLLHQAAFQA